jgi:hypothetical protein
MMVNGGGKRLKISCSDVLQDLARPSEPRSTLKFTIQQKLKGHPLKPADEIELTSDLAASVGLSMLDAKFDVFRF